MDINKEQQAAINAEVSAQKHIDEAKKIIDERRPVTIAKIEDILDQRKANELDMLVYL